MREHRSSNFGCEAGGDRSQDRPAAQRTENLPSAGHFGHRAHRRKNGVVECPRGFLGPDSISQHIGQDKQRRSSPKFVHSLTSSGELSGPNRNARLLDRCIICPSNNAPVSDQCSHEIKHNQLNRSIGGRWCRHLPKGATDPDAQPTWVFRVRRRYAAARVRRSTGSAVSSALSVMRKIRPAAPGV